MEIIFALAFIILPFFWVYVMIKPAVIRKWLGKDLTRRHITLMFSAAISASLIGMGMTAGNIPENQPIVEEPIQPTPSPTPTTQERFQDTKVTKIIDGDTIVIEGEVRVRLIGIDAPEKNDCLEKESTNALQSLIEGKTVRMEKDVSETDRYGRLLRYLWIGEELINETMVRNGFAYAKDYPPDTKYKDRLKAAQEEAQNNGRQLWGNICIAPQSN